MRVLTVDSEIGRYTQGSIFTGLRVSDGSARKGIVITARCDIAHAKSRSIVCLPIYSLSDWLDLYGNSEIAEQSAAMIQSMVAEILSKYKISSRAIQIYGIDRTLESLEEKGIKKDDLAKLNTFKPFIIKRDVNAKIKCLIENRKKYIEGIIKNSRNDTFFLERLSPHEEATGYVIDLAEPVCVPHKALQELSSGLEYIKYSRERETNYRNIIVTQSEQANTFATLQPPYTELLLQRFSIFYSRIGTPDIAKPDLKKVRKLHEIE